MFEFKDLYVNLAPEAPAPGGPAADGGGWGGWAAWWGGGGIVVFNGPGCQPGLPSQSGLHCDTVAVALMHNLMDGADGAPLALKDFLKSALEKAVQEPQNMHDAGELERLEGKLSGALEEVRARKAEVKSKAASAK